MRLIMRMLVLLLAVATNPARLAVNTACITHLHTACIGEEYQAGTRKGCDDTFSQPVLILPTTCRCVHA